MPSVTHESLVALFRDRPALASQLLVATGADLPSDGPRTPRLTSAEFAELKAAEYRADAVIRMDGADDKPSDIIIVEVQLKRDPKKGTSWPVYITGARARYGCPATILVIAIDTAIANWCAKPIVLDRNGSTVKPVVLGPNQMPRITDIDKARKSPELAILSAATHGKGENAAEVAVAGLAACDSLDTDRSARYADVILSMLGTPALQALEKLMSLHNYEFQSDFAKKYLALGREEGRQEGRAFVIRLLTKRFGALPADARARVEQADMTTLDDWAERLFTAETLDDVFSG